MKKWLIAVGVVVLLFLSQALSAWYWKRKYKSELQQQKVVLTDSLTASFEAAQKEISEHKTQLGTTRKQSTSIDSKRKEDEKTIDTRPVTTGDIDSLLSRFNEGSE